MDELREFDHLVELVHAQVGDARESIPVRDVETISTIVGSRLRVADAMRSLRLASRRMMDDEQ